MRRSRRSATTCDAILKLEDKAWLAGILDGEGCVYAGRFRQRKPGGPRYIQPGVVVTMTHEKTMRKIARLCKRPLYTHVPNYPRAKRYWSVRWWSQDTRRILDVVLPYLVTKFVQAKVLIRLTKIQAKSRKNHMASPRLQRQLYAKLKQLNR